MKTTSLSKSEMEVMAALWRIGSGTVSAIQTELHQKDQEQRMHAYTTVATHLKRMVEKEAVVARKVGRSFVFEPVEQRTDYRRVRLSDFVKQFFDGQPSSLASQFIETNSFSREELDELRRLIDGKTPK